MSAAVGAPAAAVPVGVLHHGSDPATAWSTVNATEVVPSVLTPLGATCFWGDPIEIELRRAYARIGALPAAAVRAPARADERIVGIQLGRFVGNVDTLRRLADALPGTSGDAVELQIYGRLRPGVTGSPTRRRYPVVAVKMPLEFARLPTRIRAVREANDRWWRQVVRGRPPATGAAAIAEVRQASQRYRDAMWVHMQATAFAQGLFEQVSALAAKAGKPGLELELLTGYGDLAETRILKDLWAVSRDMLTMDAFLERHGYHGAGEGEPLNPSWRQDPHPLGPLVASYRNRGDEQSPQNVERRQAAKRRAAHEALTGSMGTLARARTELLLRLAGRYIGIKEESKTAYIQAVDGGRAAATILGQLLMSDGVIDQVTDAFFLELQELEPLPPDVRQLVADRRAQHAEFARYRLPEFWTGLPEPEIDIPSTPGRSDGTEVVLEGVPVCPGTITGRAHVVRDPAECEDFADGEVLVCRVTDPSWMPLISLAAALVIDVGGPLSHCAIAARELGIPAVINTGVATSRIGTGDLVEVDARVGSVRVLRRHAAAVV
jgi:phosphohistidine swiveling domain-containing protein